MHHARKSAALLGKPSRSARDPDAKFLVLQGFGSQIERRRIAEPYHLPITADQFRSQLRRRKRQQNFPLPHERPAFELIGLSRVDGLRPIDQRRVTPDPPRYQPMDHQLRGIANLRLVDLGAHVRAPVTDRKDRLPGRRIEALPPSWFTGKLQISGYFAKWAPNLPLSEEMARNLQSFGSG